MNREQKTENRELRTENREQKPEKSTEKKGERTDNRKQRTENREILLQSYVQVGTDLEGEEDCLFFIWPTTVVHKITEDSPFYGMNARYIFLIKNKKLLRLKDL